MILLDIKEFDLFLLKLNILREIRNLKNINQLTFLII